MSDKITDEMRLRSEIFMDESEVKRRTVKLVRVRKPQMCGNPFTECHEIEPGERAYVDKAIVEGGWQSNYCCIPHLDKYIREYQL